MDPEKSFHKRVFDCDIAGWNVVEASAGTGKTYQIANLYARVILETGWTVDQLLVVTFTEAATQELRQRLQAVLTTVAQALGTGDQREPHASDATDIDRLIGAAVGKLVAEQGKTDEQASLICRFRARRACAEFDRASIFTIHGFCGRMLSECAFECGIDFDAEQIGDKGQLINEVAMDVLRRSVLTLTDMEAALAYGESLATLSRLATDSLGKPDAAILPDLADKEASCLPPEVRELIIEQAATGKDEIQAVLDAGVRYGAIAAQARTQILGHLQNIIDDGFSIADLAAVSPEARKKHLIAQLPELSGSLRGFAEACQTIGERWRVQKGGAKGPTAASVWLPQLDTDPQTQKALQTLLDIAGEQGEGGWLDALLDFHGSAFFFKSKIYNIAKKKGDILYAALKTGDAEKLKVKGVFGTLSGLSPGVIESNIRETPAWPSLKPLTDISSLWARCSKRWKLWFKRQFVEDFRIRLNELKLERNVVTYDDLLVNLRDALVKGGATTKLLKDAVRQRFKMAIIDEFQDTDPVQYRVFWEAFHEQDPELPVFLVGDPKQAVYSFRSGDLETYFDAREQAPENRRFSLLTNWRSTGNMINAVNELFAEPPQTEPVHGSFATPKIVFTPAVPPESGASGTAHPLTIDLVPMQDGEKIKKNAGVSQSAELAAKRIAELTGRGVPPQNIAVLIQRHREAPIVKEALARHGIPAVLQSAGRVFDSDEAADLLQVMAAMLDPKDLSSVRCALATPLFATTGAELAIAGTGIIGQAVQEAAGAFEEAHQNWKHYGFLVGVTRILRALKSREHLLSTVNGERRVTNVLQIAEIVDRAAREQKLGIFATLRWLERQLDKDNRIDSDEHEIRLESDEDAVTIMTVFKSKGLQFPYVVAPFMWTKNPTTSNSSFLEYHEGARLQLNLDKDDDFGADLPGHNGPKNWHQDESLQEQVRLLYVAVTRAKLQTHLISGEFGDDHRHALNYLLTPKDRPKQDDPSVSKTKKVADAAIEVNGAYIERNPTSIAPDLPPQPQNDVATGVTLDSQLTLGHPVDKNWQILSFSKLADHGHAHLTMSATEIRDYDGETPQDKLAATQLDRETLSRDPKSLFSFVPGKKTGNCWHAIFEHMDFTQPTTHRQLVEDWAGRFRLIREAEETNTKATELRTQRIQTLCNMVKATLDLELGPRERPVKLSTVAPTDCLAEMQFDFPVADGGVSRKGIAQALIASDWSKKNSFSDILNDWIKKAEAARNRRITKLPPDAAEDEMDDVTLRGFMTGFIDLTFRVHDDSLSGHPYRYYLLDWKSNRLDGTFASFDADSKGITDEMGRNRYFFQYLLYSVAVHHFLLATIGKENYSYDDHFGGAYYVFLRGVMPPAEHTGDWEAKRCVYSDRPSLDVINKLSAALGLPGTEVSQ